MPIFFSQNVAMWWFSNFKHECTEEFHIEWEVVSGQTMGADNEIPQE